MHLLRSLEEIKQIDVILAWTVSACLIGPRKMRNKSIANLLRVLSHNQANDKTRFGCQIVRFPFAALDRNEPLCVLHA